MVAPDPDQVSPGEVVVDDHRRQQEQQQQHKPFSSLGRQSSIYSLTLDEFQHALNESGKNFGSMNMDEFLASIWTAEENQHHSHQAAAANSGSCNNGDPKTPGLGPTYEPVPENSKGGLASQRSLPRQGSLTLPAPLCRKTVDEVWSEIHRSGQGQHGNGNEVGGGGGNVGNPGNAGRQPTFGEMTLEDFLIKAGVVREQQCGVPSVPAVQHYGVYQGGSDNASVNVGGGFTSRAMPGGSGVGYAPPNQAGVYGGRVGNGGGGGGGGYVAGGGMMGPVSPVSNLDGMVGGGGVDGGGGQYGMDMGGIRGRKRIIDGPVEKVVERRQRRMIKNRESAARSRARKQAYTVELEAELNQLKEENRQLKQAVAELERKRKQQYIEETRMKTPTKSQKAKERLRLMRRNMSCPL